MERSEVFLAEKRPTVITVVHWRSNLIMASGMRAAIVWTCTCRTFIMTFVRVIPAMIASLKPYTDVATLRCLTPGILRW